MPGENIGHRRAFASEVGSNLPSATADDQNVDPAAETRMAEKQNQKIGRRKVFESEDES